MKAKRIRECEFRPSTDTLKRLKALEKAYGQSHNPAFAWEALFFSLAASAEVPGWVLRYLERAAVGIHDEARGPIYVEPGEPPDTRRAPVRIAEALGFEIKPGRGNPLTQLHAFLADEAMGLMVAHKVRDSLTPKQAAMEVAEEIHRDSLYNADAKPWALPTHPHDEPNRTPSEKLLERAFRRWRSRGYWS